MVEIPDDVAKHMAAYFRKIDVNGQHPDSLPGDRWADLLDPKPPTLREQVVHQFREFDIHWDDDAADVIADAVLAVVADAPIEQLIALVGPRFADWLAAQPLADTISNGAARMRDHDVSLLRGQS